MCCYNQIIYLCDHTIYQVAEWCPEFCKDGHCDSKKHPWDAVEVESWEDVECGHCQSKKPRITDWEGMIERKERKQRTQSTESTQSTQSTQSTESTQSTQSTESTQSTQSTESTTAGGDQD